MAKKVKDARAAKDARQKKIAIVGLVLFIAVAAFQVPRTMKLLKGPETPAAAPATTAPNGSTSSLEPPSLTGAGATDTGAAAPAVAASGAGSNTLVTFGRFESKDPFRPQVDRSNLGGENPAAAAPAGAPTVPGAAGGGQGSTPPVTSMPRVTTPAASPTSAVISVNGVPEVVAAGADFPALEPTFKLVSLTAKAAKIAIAGGSYANGDPTVTLKRGQTLTLMNTSDGRRYQLKWLPDSAAPATTFTPATTPAAPAPAGS